MAKSDDPGFEAAAKEVLEELRNNRQGAYAIAVRVGAHAGYPADKLMLRAVEMEKESPAPGAARELVAVEFPLAEEIELAIVEGAEADGGLGPDALVLAKHVALAMVEERKRFQRMLGVL